MKGLLVVVTIIVGAPMALRAAEKKIVVLHQEAVAGDELRLIEALRIYTRDLDTNVVARGDAPTVVDATALEMISAAARAEDAEVVLWAQNHDHSGTVFYMFDAPSGDVRQTQTAAIGADRAAMEVALKVRALLSGRRGIRSEESRPPGSQGGSGSPGTIEGEGGTVRPREAPVLPPATPTAPVLAENRPHAESPRPAQAGTRPVAEAQPGLESHPTAPATATAVAENRPRLEPRLPRVTLDGGFHLVSPTDPTWLRVGVLVGGAVRLGGATSRYWLTLDGAFTSKPHAQVLGTELTLGDRPFGAGVQAAWSYQRVNVLVGPRASFHIFDAEAISADGRTGAARRYALGLGGLARLELSVVSRVRMALSVSVEGLVPTQEFTIAGQPGMSTGSALFGATIGVVVPIR